MKKITEAELSNRVNLLREKLVLENNSAVDEAWYDPSSWGKPDYQATTAQQGKKSQRNYAMALQQIKDLYNKAEVSYPPKDDIVRQRYGLPPALPAFDQWDGKMPNAEQADYLTRNLFGRSASADAQTQNAANQSAAQKKITTDAAVDAKVEELKKTVTSLLALIGTRDAKTGGAVTTADQPMESIMKRLRNLIAEADVAVDDRNEMDKASDAAAAPTDKAGLIQQCQLLMSEIEKLEGNDHDPETVEALKNAQAAIDQAAQTPDEAKPGADASAAAGGDAAKNPNGTNADTAIPSGPQTVPGQEGDKAKDPAVNGDTATSIPGGQAAGGNGVAPTSEPAPQGFGQAFRAARNLQMKKDPTNPGGGIFTWNGKQYTTQQKDDTAAPSPREKESPYQIQKPSPYQYQTYPPKDVPPEDRDRLGLRETVSYADDQTLARIVSLSRR